MLQAIELLKKKYKLDFLLQIVGSGDGQKKLEIEAIERGIINNIQFMGEVIGVELEKIYEQADLFVHTSITEGFATVFIEAMAKGLPIVATNIAGTRDVVKNKRNGLLVGFSAEEISQSIIQLVSDSTFYQTISKNNIEDVKKYNWDAIVENTLSVYTEIKNKSL